MAGKVDGAKAVDYQHSHNCEGQGFSKVGDEGRCFFVAAENEEGEEAAKNCYQGYDDYDYCVSIHLMAPS